MSHDVLPFWGVRGINPKTGLAYESLRTDGSGKADASLRVRVQFRQIYSFAHAAAAGWYPEGKQIALNLWDRVSQTCRAPNGARGFVHVLAPDLTVANATRDSYDHAFAILALSWLAKASGDHQVLAEIDTILALIDDDMSDQFGFLTEGIPNSTPRRQNPQMHWFEAMLALREATGHLEAPVRAHRHFALFKRFLLDKDSLCLGEYFNDDWSIAEGERGQEIEPGHFAEWVWLIRHYERLFDLPMSDLPTRILARTERFCDPSTRLLPDLAHRNGSVLVSTRRIWLQTELCKARLSEVDAAREGSRHRAQQALHDLNDYYLRVPFPQGWVDRLAPDGTRLPGPVPTSILYHLFVAILEADRVLGDAQATD